MRFVAGFVFLPIEMSLFFLRLYRAVAGVAAEAAVTFVLEIFEVMSEHS